MTQLYGVVIYFDELLVVRINNIRKDDAAGHDFILQETCDVSRPRV
jgi:hypothetical protein